MRIGFLSTDWGDHVENIAGGCTHVRMETPALALQKIGHDVHLGEIGWKEDHGFVCVPPIARLIQGDRKIIRNPQQYEGNLDVVILKLFMHEQASSYIEKARKLGQTVIIDTDDHFEQLPIDNIAYHTTDPKANAENNRDHLIRSYSKASGIIASTKFLHDKMKRHNDNTIEVNNALDPKDFIRRIDRAGTKPTIGWVGVMLWRVEDIKEVSGVIKQFVEENDLTFHHSGIVMDRPNWFCEATGLHPSYFTGQVGTQPKWYGNVFMPIDVGIVPLTNNPFNEAKSNLKGLEYALSGIPFIASSTHEYRKLRDEGVGLVADKPRDWLKNLNKMIDPDFRRQMAERQYELVSVKYNIDNMVHSWEEAIETIVKRSK